MAGLARCYQEQVSGPVSKAWKRLKAETTFTPYVGKCLSCRQSRPALRPPWRSCSQPHRLRGASICRQGQLEQAEPLFRKAAQCAEGVDGGRCHYEFGCCLGAMGRGSEAIQEFQACLRVGGVQPGFVHLELGLALAGMGQHQQALRHLEAAARASPHLAVVHHTLGVVLTAVEQVDLAKAAFTTALGLDPGSVRSMQGLAAAQAAGGDRAAAIKTLREAVRLADDDPALLTLLGDALLREGLLADAEALFVKALHSNPASQPLLDRLANLRFPIHTSFALLVAPGSESGQLEEDMGGVEASLLEQGYLKENIFSLSGAVATPKVSRYGPVPLIPLCALATRGGGLWPPVPNPMNQGNVIFAPAAGQGLTTADSPPVADSSRCRTSSPCSKR